MKKFYILFIGYIFSLTSFAQWEQTNGPYGGDIFNIAILNDSAVPEIFAGTRDLFRTTNEGLSWNKVSGNLPLLQNRDILSLVTQSDSSGTNLFVTISFTGVFRSTNKGLEWTDFNYGLQYPFGGILAVSDTFIFLGGSGIHSRSLNAPIWTRLNSSLEAEELVAFPNGAGGHNLFAGNSSGIFRSTDSGENWTPVFNTNKRIYDLEYIIDSTGIVHFYALVGFDSIYYSSNMGDSWTALNSLPYTVDLLITPDMSLYAGRTNGIYKTTDNGLTWSDLSNEMGHSRVYRLRFYETGENINLLAGVFNKGIFLSTTNGLNWDERNEGLAGTSIRSFVNITDEQGTEKLFAASEGGVFLTTDNGEIWTGGTDGIIWRRQGFTAVPDPEGAILIAGNIEGIFVSFDSGLHWEQRNNGLTLVYVHAVLAAPDGAAGYNLYAAASTWTGIDEYSIIFRSTNLGLDWSPVLSVSSFILALGAQDNYLFAGTEWGEIYRSVNNGLDWTMVKDTDIDIFDFETVTSGDASYIFATGFHNFAGVYRSTDHGESWSESHNGIPSSASILGIKAYETDAGNKLIAYEDDSLYISTNFGDEWYPVTTGLRNISDLIVSGNYLFAGTYQKAVWKRRLDDLLTPVDEQNPFIKNFHLAQNYPNPFNPSTTIKFSVPAAGLVALKIYDILGREVRTLINSEYTPGNYSVEFNARGLSSGVYFYRLIAEGYSDVKKMQVMK